MRTSQSLSVKADGFTLVELSIVLVILGLLVGGVLSGQALIRSAELRSVVRDFEKFETAGNAFADKYFALPGDMNNAFAYWGAAVSCTNVDVNSNQAGCNGNGDGRVDAFRENYRAWQHLALAGLIEGSFSGISTSNAGIIGTNTPAAKYNAGGYEFVGDRHFNDHMDWPYYVIANFVMIGKTYMNMPPVSGILTTVDAYTLDMKVDDGMPTTGKMVGGQGRLASNCLVTVSSVRNYDIAGTSPAICNVAWRVK